MAGTAHIQTEELALGERPRGGAWARPYVNDPRWWLAGVPLLNCWHPLGFLAVPLALAWYSRALLVLYW